VSYANRSIVLQGKTNIDPTAVRIAGIFSWPVPFWKFDYPQNNNSVAQVRQRDLRGTGGHLRPSAQMGCPAEFREQTQQQISAIEAR
jgi:hypothetical protein